MTSFDIICVNFIGRTTKGYISLVIIIITIIFLHMPAICVKDLLTLVEIKYRAKRFLDKRFCFGRWTFVIYLNG